MSLTATLRLLLNHSIAAVLQWPLRSIASGIYPGKQFAFIPIADERIVFENYVQRYENASSPLVPAIIETDHHELNVFGAKASADSFANKTFLCTAAKTS